MNRRLQQITHPFRFNAESIFWMLRADVFAYLITIMEILKKNDNELTLDLVCSGLDGTAGGTSLRSSAVLFAIYKEQWS